MTPSSPVDSCTLSPTNSWMLVSFLNSERPITLWSSSTCAHPPGDSVSAGGRLAATRTGGQPASLLMTSPPIHHPQGYTEVMGAHSHPARRPWSRQLFRKAEGVRPLPSPPRPHFGNLPHPGPLPAPLHGLCRERAKGLCTRVCKHQLYQASECQGGLLLLSGPWALPGQHAEAGVQSAGTSSWVPASQAQEHRTSAHEAKMFGQGPGWVALKSRNCPTYPENLAKNTPSPPRFISQIPGTCAPPPGDGQTGHRPRGEPSASPPWELLRALHTRRHGPALCVAASKAV